MTNKPEGFMMIERLPTSVGTEESIFEKGNME